MITLHDANANYFTSMTYMSLPENDFTWNGTKGISPWIQQDYWQKPLTASQRPNRYLLNDIPEVDRIVIPYRNANRCTVLDDIEGYKEFNAKNSFVVQNGYGELVDAISCKVTNENNGEYELELMYPITGHLIDYIKLRNIIACKSSPYDDHDQAFRIYKITEPIDGIITVYAHHISYDISRCYLISNINARQNNPDTEALSKVKETEPYSGVTDSTNGYAYYIEHAFNETENTIKNALNDPNVMIQNNLPPIPDFLFEFHYWPQDSSGNKYFNLYSPRNVKAFLGGSEDSVLDVFGGDLLFDNFEIWLMYDVAKDLLPNHSIVPEYKKKGHDNGVIINIGKDILSFTNELNTDVYYSHIVPFWQGDVTYKNSSGNDTTLKQLLVLPYTSIEGGGTYPPRDSYYPKIDNGETRQTDYFAALPVDFSDAIDVSGYSEETAPNTSKTKIINEISAVLVKLADEYMRNNKIGHILSTLNISLVNTNDPNIMALKKIKLCDIVTCVIEEYGIFEKMKCIKTEYDAITNSYISVTLGDAERDLSTTISSIYKKTNKETSKSNIIYPT